MEVIIANKVVILAFLFAASELLALIPSVKSNSIFTLIYNALKKVTGK